MIASFAERNTRVPRSHPLYWKRFLGDGLPEEAYTLIAEYWIKQNIG